jgi:hypothetical protein
MGGKSCSWCGHTGAELGFMGDGGQYSTGYGQWVAGELETGSLGWAKRRGRAVRAVYAYRCTQCSHLELFAGLPIT